MIYLAYDDTLIYGMGTTPEAAVKNALDDCADLDRLRLFAGECTKALAMKVDAEGGAIAWGVNDDGILCTVEEED